MLQIATSVDFPPNSQVFKTREVWFAKEGERMKHIGLRTKTLISVSLILVLALGTSTFVQISSMSHSYRQALIWRSEALAHSLSNDLAHRFSAASEDMAQLTSNCQQLYATLAPQHITYIAVLDAEGVIIAHNDPAKLHISSTRPLFRQQLATQRPVTFLEDAIYHTLLPVLDDQSQKYVGSVAIGFSEQAITATIRETLFQAAIVVGVFVVFACLALFFLIQTFISRPVQKLIEVGQRLAEGRPIQTIYTTGTGDEIAVLGTVFYRIARYVQQVADMASRIANGVLTEDLLPRSDHDVLGLATQKMMQYLREIAAVAANVAKGDFSDTVSVRSPDDTFGRELQRMTAGLRELITQIRTRVDQIAETGVMISTQTEQDIELAERVHVVTEHMMETMQDIGASVEEVAHSMTTLSSSVQETSDSVVMITTSITHIASNASELTERSHTTITAMEGATERLEEVVKSTNISEQLSQETIHDALEGQQAFDQVMTSMQTIQGTIATAVDAITGFEERSRDIDTILNVIRDITEQTSLLALNASIIAAQAGEHGRGFAVVADEIKSLAQGVGASTKDIATILHTLQTNTHMVVHTIRDGAASVEQGMERTHQAQMSLDKIIQSARRSSTVVSEIADALRKVMATSRDVVAAMEEVSAMTDDFTLATNEQESSTEQINNAIAQINIMTSNIRAATDKQLRGVHQMLGAGNDVTALIDQNLESSQQIARTTGTLVSQADLLIHSVDRFKLEKQA